MRMPNSLTKGTSEVTLHSFYTLNIRNKPGIPDRRVVLQYGTNINFVGYRIKIDTSEVRKPFINKQRRPKDFAAI